MTHFKTKLKEETLKFISSWKNCEWLEVEPVSIYLRKGMRHLDGEWVPCIEIGNVGVLDEHRQQGYFRAACEVVEDVAKDVPMMDGIKWSMGAPGVINHENPLNFLAESHLRKVYKQKGDENSYYKIF